MILLASASPSLCRRWRNSLAGRFPLHQAMDRQSLTSAISQYSPKIVFLDHTEKHFGPNRLICNLIRAAHETKFIVFTRVPSDNEAIQLIKAGAKGYCATNIGAPLLSKAAQVVAGGEIWIGRKLLPALFDEFARTASAGAEVIQRPSRRPGAMRDFNGLSPREREITSLVATGQQNKLISNTLHISEKTVKAHLTTIYRKLGVDGRTQLALAAVNSKLQLTAPINI